MRPFALALALLAAPAAAQVPDTPDALRARIVALEAQVAAQAETIARLTAERDARLSAEESDAIRAAMGDQTRRLTRAELDLDACRRDARQADLELARSRDEANRFRTDAQVQRSRADTAERRAETERRDRQRAESEARRLNSALMRCR